MRSRYANRSEMAPLHQTVETPFWYALAPKTSADSVHIYDMFMSSWNAQESDMCSSAPKNYFSMRTDWFSVSVLLVYHGSALHLHPQS